MRANILSFGDFRNGGLSFCIGNVTVNLDSANFVCVLGLCISIYHDGDAMKCIRPEWFGSLWRISE